MAPESETGMSYVILLGDSLTGVAWRIALPKSPHTDTIERFPRVSPVSSNFDHIREIRF